MIFWTIGVVVVVAVVGAIALQVAISRNGPAVLSAVDSLTGGATGAELKTTVSTGEHPQQKLTVWGVGPQDEISMRKPVIVFMHGGSWRSGDPEDYGFMGRALVERGFVVVLGGYRLGEAGVYPAMLEDTAAVIAWTQREIAEFDGDPERIVVAGHSAGAYNVVMAALEEQWLASEGLSVDAVKGVVGLSGPYDFYPFDSDSTIAAFGPADDPESTQPIAHIRGDAPPMLLVHGEQDDLVKIRNSRELARRIEAAGGAISTRYYDDMNHNDPLISFAAPWRSQRDVAEMVAEFAREASLPATVSVPVQDETG